MYKGYDTFCIFRKATTDIDGSRQLKIAHRGAANDRLTPPLSKEVTVRAHLVNGYEGPSSTWAEITNPGTNRTTLEQAKEAFFQKL